MLGITNTCPALHRTYSAIGVSGTVLGIDDNKDKPLEPGLRALQRQDTGPSIDGVFRVSLCVTCMGFEAGSRSWILFPHL